MSRNLVFLTYDVRPEFASDDYEDFVRAEDYPAFRKRPSVLEYSGFKVVKNHVGEAPFSRFDLLYIDEFENYEKDVLGDPELRKHSNRWLKLCSVHGDQEPHESGRNFKVELMKEI